MVKKEVIFKRKNIIITGGAGFIGSHLSEKLIADNNIICIDNFITSDSDNIKHLLRNPNFAFINHDINEPLDLEKIPEISKFQISLAGIQEIYHLACPTSPKQFEKYKVQTAVTNSIGTRNALDLAVKYQAKFLHASSSVIYGGSEEGGYTRNEKDVGCVETTGPRSCYDEGKRFAETLVSTYGEHYKLDYKIARIFRTFGPRMRLNDGQMIPDFITNALDNKDLVIYGDENFTSSFCYISDIIEGIISLMESSVTQPVNLGSAENYLVSDIAKQIIDMVQSESVVKFENPLLFMRPLCLPDISFAKEQLGWFPIVTINEGLKRTIEYAIAEKGLVKFKTE